MRYRWAPALLALACTAQAGGPAPASKVILGLHEQVHIRELGLTLPAKLDTGAESASLSADQVRTFLRDGHQMVSFALAVDADTREKWGLGAGPSDRIELPLADHVRIKQRAESALPGDKGYTRRPVVALTLCVGDRLATVEVNLTDRRAFSYPLLVGSEALRDLGALVDPAVSMGRGAPDCARGGVAAGAE
ncbi:ATP-dependent zinc protease family protein [Alloalcanivorax mobilis]|uniref:ATP-dependent zinc protease family protein n=1 Tax=Alloalcanivorax mobilis TaxID=2019569 RepID=UPI000C75A6D0|nr:RimK/LysX family protein [Alloalcanivorax mobilis]